MSVPQNSDQPLVTIGVPVYNGEKYLAECLASIADQTYQNWVCHVINNKSTDNSLAIAEEFQRKDSRIRVFTNPEFVDMTTNFNNTFRNVSPDSKYFKVVCADDWIFPDFLEKAVSVLEKYPQAGIFSAYRIDNREVNCDGLDIYKGNVFNGKEILVDQLLGRIMITGSETTVLYRIEALRKIKEFPVIFSYNSYHFDTSLAYELLSLADLGYYFQVLSYTRRHELTYTSKYVDRFRTNLNLEEKELYKYRHLSSELQIKYKRIRAQYAYYMLLINLKRDKMALEWHKKRLDKERRFGLPELFSSMIIITWNRIIYKLKRFTG
jgi:glycosyltransferase involved in cell wall biosynthesis